MKRHFSRLCGRPGRLFDAARNKALPSVALVLFLAVCILLHQAACFRLEPSDTSAASAATGLTPAATAPLPPTGPSWPHGPTTRPRKLRQQLDEQFDQLADEQIQSGLAHMQPEIRFDEILAWYDLTYDQYPELINRIYQRYQNILLADPAYFYLDGSFISDDLYDNPEARIETLVIKPSFWTSYACLTEEELAEAIDQVQREADRWALEISRETGDSWQQLARLHDRLVRHVAFSWTAENHAGAALVRRSTLCQGYAQAFQLVGQKLGYAVLVIIGEAHEFCHAWNMVCLDGTWYHVDVTFDDPEPDGGDDGFVSRRYVLRSDLVMLETHRWDSSKYPDCPRDSGLNLWAGEQAANSRAQLAERLDTFLQKIDFQGGLTYRTEFFYAGQDLPDVAEWTDLVDQAMYRYRKKPACCWWAGSGLSVLSLVIKTRCDE